MRVPLTTRTKLAVIATATLAICAGTARASAAAHDIPQSQSAEHQENLQHLRALSGRPGKVGAVARKAVALFKQHDAREAEYVMPPLSLLPLIVAGKITPDMQWAVDMADRVRADHDLLFAEQTELIAVMNELQVAGHSAHDAEAVDFAHSAATDALTDLEVFEPTALLIGDSLRVKLSGKP